MAVLVREALESFAAPRTGATEAMRMTAAIFPWKKGGRSVWFSGRANTG